MTGGAGWRTRLFVVFALIATSLGVRTLVRPQLAAAAAATPSPAITEFVDPVNGSDPVGIAAGPDGNVWVTDSNDFDTHKIVSVTPFGSFTPYNVDPGGGNCCSDPLGIVKGSDNNMWFTESTTGANEIGRIAGGVYQHFALPQANSMPTAITAGPPGTLWFTEAGVSGTAHGPATIGRITTGGAVSEFLTGHPYNAPYGMTMGPDGKIWYTEQSDLTGTAATYVSAINPSTQAISSIQVAGSGVGLSGVTAGSDNNIWFTEMNTTPNGDQLGRIVPSGGSGTWNRSVQDPGTGVNSITTGPDGFLYFTEPQSNSIGRIDPRTIPASGTVNVTEHFSVITNPGFSLGAPPTGITAGPDGNIWFTEGSGKSEGGPSPVHNVGRLTLTPAVSFSAMPGFGVVPINATSSPQNVVATTGGVATLTFSGFSLTGANPGDFKISSNGCAPASLSAADNATQTCSIGVTFKPTTAGARSATLHVTDNAGSQDIALSGTGLSGSATPSPSSIAFGSQTVNTTSAARSVTITNPSGGSLIVSAVSIGGANPGDFTKTADGCSGTTVAAGGTCSVSVSFAPTATGGRAASLSFTDSAGDSPQNVALSGTGVAQSSPPPPPPPPSPPPTPVGGYWLAATDGGIFNYGVAGFFGSTGNIHLNKPIVGMAATPSGHGYWLVASDGGIFSYGDAGFFGSAGGINLNKPIVGMAATPSGHGYWLVATDGGIFSYGDAKFFGSTGNIHLNQPIVAMAATRSGGGYWLSASDGGIFNYGDAKFFGSTGSIHLNKPIVSMAAAPDGSGYWLAATDGGIFNFGSARFFGSTGAIHLNQPVVGMAGTGDGSGYWLVASDGGIFNFGSAGFFGSAGAIHLNRPIVVMAAAP